MKSKQVVVDKPLQDDSKRSISVDYKKKQYYCLFLIIDLTTLRLKVFINFESTYNILKQNPRIGIKSSRSHGKIKHLLF